MSKLSRKIKRQAARQEIADNHKRTQELIDSRRNLGVAQMLDGMIQQGISREDLAKEYTRGFEAGRDAVMKKYEDAAKPYMMVYVAATALTLHRLHGFGSRRAGQVIADALDYVKNGLWLDPDDVVRQCREETGLDISTMQW